MKDWETAVATIWEKCKEEEAKAHKAYNVEKATLDEAKDRLRAQESLFNERKKLLIRLPTNQAVIPIHNALLEEHTKERMLIADSFKAIKDGKADLREKTADRVSKVEETYRSEQDAHKRQIERLLRIAKIARISANELLDRQSECSSIWPNLPASATDNSSTSPPLNNAPESTMSIDDIIEHFEKGNTYQKDILKQMTNISDQASNTCLKRRIIVAASLLICKQAYSLYVSLIVAMALR